MPFTIVRQDITKMAVDAIVNAANTDLQAGGGVCGAIFKAAGAAALQKACDKLAPIKTGEAVVTPGFGLAAKYIIHTAGPVYHDGCSGEEEQLRASYTNSLKRALEHGCASVAFPLISSGIYGYPKDEALRVARESIVAFLETEELDVYLAVFDGAAFALSHELQEEVEAYIDEHYVDARREQRRMRTMADVEVLEDFEKHAPAPQELRFGAAVAAEPSLDALLETLDEPFADLLLELIRSRGKSEVEVYKRANIDRKLFSKIRNGKNYMPKKKTVLALAIGLGLNVRETEALLSRAGYAFSNSQKFDVIVRFFLEREDYDIFRINEVLFSHDQELLGSV